MKTINETDYEYRLRAMECLRKAKQIESCKKLIPLRLNDRDKTVLLVSPRLSLRQREKLKQKKLEQLSRRRVQELID